MGGVHRFSDRVIDYAERLSDMADAAEGKRHRVGGQTTRLMLLPAAGAAFYALLRSDRFSRQAKDVLGEAKSRAAELPDDLLARVRQTSGSSRSSAQASRNGSSARRSTTSQSTKSRRRRSPRTAKSAAR